MKTERIGLATGVTCPSVRYHPAIIAQAAATLAIISAGRFTLGVGVGERLNEHVVGLGFPGARVRHARFREAPRQGNFLPERRLFSAARFVVGLSARSVP